MQPRQDLQEDPNIAPVWDVGLQHRSARHGANAVVVNENWTVEERQV